MAIALLAGCKPKPASTSGSGNYFQTPFQSECQYLVEAIVADLAEQVSYAASHQLPDSKQFSVSAHEKAGSPVDAPVYRVAVRVGSPQRVLKLEVKIDGTIWSPALYQELTAELARGAGLKPSRPNTVADTELVAKLLEINPLLIEEENQALSKALEKDFTDPELHEKAALLLGGFLLRDHSGNFFDLRSGLCRMTAHLALAQYLRDQAVASRAGQLAEATLLTLVTAQAPALAKLGALATNEAPVAAFARALWTRNTGDYRRLASVQGRSPLESIEWFTALADYVSAPTAWPELSDSEKQTIDYVRLANQVSYSVEIGHDLLRSALPLELREIQTVYARCQGQPLPAKRATEALNAVPERCFSLGSDGKPRVLVIGWGQWAAFLQRHLCHAIQQGFEFMSRKWGVQEEANAFASQCEQQFGQLRLYPFVRRFTCTDVASYHRAVDDGFAVTVATPHLVPAECWNHLCYKPRFAPLYNPKPNPHINEWHNHNPPPGTDYDLNPRLNHPSLVRRPDAVACFERLHELAPYDCRVVACILERKYNSRPSYDQAMALFRNVLPYSVFALRRVADTVRAEPEQFEKVMLQAAQLNPSCYYELGDYVAARRQADQAAEYIEKACAADPDQVRVASRAEGRVYHFLKQGQTAKARKIADEAGEVYSFQGLAAKAFFFEYTTNYDEAFAWYARIEERYDDASPLIAFCQRYKALTRDSRLDAEVQKRLNRLFPRGMPKVSLSDLQGAPTNGVLIRDESDLLKAAGLNRGDVIVAVNGIRVGNVMQYNYGRDMRNSPELALIVWQGEAYREVKASPPNRRFGVELGNYAPRPAAQR